MIYFICTNDYQVMQAAAYTLNKNEQCTVFLPTIQVNYKDQDFIKFKQVHYDFMNLSIAMDYHLFKSNEIELFKVIQNPDEELHTFEFVENLFFKGRDNIILHEQGDKSYIKNSNNLYGEDDADTVFRMYTSSKVNKTKRNIEWDFTKELYKNKKLQKKIRDIFFHGLSDDLLPDENTVLFIHNAPDEKYTEREKREIENELKQLLFDIKSQGYTIWFKTHHKRASLSLAQLYSNKIISNIPVELIPNLDKFKYIISVRNNALHNLPGDNIINALTREAVTKCKKNWKYVYSRGIQKIRKKLNLT